MNNEHKCLNKDRIEARMPLSNLIIHSTHKLDYNNYHKKWDPNHLIEQPDNIDMADDSAILSHTRDQVLDKFTVTHLVGDHKR